MKKQEFINLASEIWVNFEIEEVISSVEKVFLEEKSAVNVSELRKIVDDIGFLISAMRNLSYEAMRFVDEIDKKDLLKHGRKTPLKTLSDWLVVLSSQAEDQLNAKKQQNPSAGHGEPNVARHKLIGNPLMVSYYSLLKEFNTVCLISQKITPEDLLKQSSEGLIKITFHAANGHNTSGLIQFLEMLEYSARFLCEHYKVDYSPVRIISVETGSLEFMIGLPIALLAVVKSAEGIVNLAGIFLATADKYVNLKVSIHKTKQFEIDDLIREQNLIEATEKAKKSSQESINSLLQTSIQITDLQGRAGALDRLERQQIFEIIMNVAPDDLAQKAKPAIEGLFLAEKKEHLSLSPASEPEQNN